jgi:predicted dehydrogenase
MSKRRIRMGMVGGGIGAFIGAVHRHAAALDGEIDLVCGAFSGSPKKSKKSGAELGLPADRVYGTFEEMIISESKLQEDVRMDCVSIVTPNHVHFAPSKMALEHGFHVICDKPMSFDLKEAKELKEVVEKSNSIFALTHNYTGYPMVKQAREMIKNGEIGQVRKIVVEYLQGWLYTNLEDSGQKQASWRTDPSKSGAGGSMGDIGTHAENLAEYITGLEITEMCADLSAFIPGRKLDDDANILLRFEKGAKGVLFCSQVAVGEENGLRIRIYGSKAGLEWAQEEPNTLTVKYQEKSNLVHRTGVGELYPSVQAHTRIPAGHPEGYLEAFANIYRNFAKCIQAKITGEEVDPVYNDFPSVDDGVRGMNFIEKAVESSKSGAIWVKM